MIIFSDTSSVVASSYEIDNTHSKIQFKVKQLVLTVKGEFTRFKGSIEFDPTDRAHSSARAVIDVASIDTKIVRRDEHLRSPDFFDVERFPEIAFKSRRVEGNQVVGDLSMHGVTREVTLTFVFDGITRALGNDRVRFRASTELNRKDFGINYSKTWDKGVWIGDKVKVDIYSAGSKTVNRGVILNTALESQFMAVLGIKIDARKD